MASKHSSFRWCPRGHGAKIDYWYDYKTKQRGYRCRECEVYWDKNYLIYFWEGADRLREHILNEIRKKRMKFYPAECRKEMMNMFDREEEMIPYDVHQIKKKHKILSVKYPEIKTNIANYDYFEDEI